MALPTLTPEQRADALKKAAEARKKRAEIKGELKSGKRTLADVLKKAEGDDTVGKMKVSTVLESLPGVGQGARAEDDGGARHLGDAPRARPRVEAARSCCSRSSARSRRAPLRAARPAHRHRGPLRRREGHRSSRRLLARDPDRLVRVGLGDHARAAPGRERRRRLPLRRRRRVRPASTAAGALLGGRRGLRRHPLRDARARSWSGSSTRAATSILEIDVQGAHQVRAAAPEAVLVLLAPPSMDDLEARLRGRGTETEAAIAERLRDGEPRARRTRRVRPRGGERRPGPGHRRGRCYHRGVPHPLTCRSASR